MESNLAFMNGISHSRVATSPGADSSHPPHVLSGSALFPVQFSGAVPGGGIAPGAAVLTESGQAAGKYRAGLGDGPGLAPV